MSDRSRPIPSEGAAPMQTFTPSERRVTLIGLMIVFLLAALDQTIVATAMPRIVVQLKGLNLYAWVSTAYLLSSTVMVPIYGRLSDLYGRKVILLFGVAMFTVGSVLCGLAGEFGSLPVLGGGMVQLIVFRAVQGLGGGALFISAFSIIADMFAPRERGRFAGIFGSVFGLASILGPLIGGFFTELAPLRLGAATVEGWRWIFYINLPLSLLSLFMIAVKMPPLTHRRPGQIDWIGAALIVITFVPLLLALSLGGREAAWGSAPILGLFAVSVLGLGLFVAAEARSPYPILSLVLFRNKTFTTANFSIFIVFTAFMGVVTFLPLYLQLGLGATPEASGVSLLPLTLGLVVSSGASGYFVNKTGRFKAVLVGGVCVLVLGMLLLVLAPAQASLGDIGWRILIMGIGLGPTQSLYSVAVQNAVAPGDIGVATSSSQFFRQIGSTIGVAVFGTVLTNALAASGAEGSRRLTLSALETLSALRSAGGAQASGMGLDLGSERLIAAAMSRVFLVGLVILVIGAAVTALIPAAKLRGRGPRLEEALEGAAPAEGVKPTMTPA